MKSKLIVLLSLMIFSGSAFGVNITCRIGYFAPANGFPGMDNTWGVWVTYSPQEEMEYERMDLDTNYQRLPPDWDFKFYSKRFYAGAWKNYHPVKSWFTAVDNNGEWWSLWLGMVSLVGEVMPLSQPIDTCGNPNDYERIIRL